MANPRAIAVVLFLCLCAYSLQEDGTIDSTLRRLENYVKIKLDEQDFAEADLQGDCRNKVCIRDQVTGQQKSFSKEAPCCSVPFSPVAGVGCVMIYLMNAKFHDARQLCSSIGAAHVVVEEADQRAALVEFVKMAQPWMTEGVSFWVGIMDGLWLSGAPVTNEPLKYPFPKTPENCGMMNLRGELTERNCTTTSMSSICQKIQ